MGEERCKALEVCGAEHSMKCDVVLDLRQRFFAGAQVDVVLEIMLNRLMSRSPFDAWGHPGWTVSSGLRVFYDGQCLDDAVEWISVPAVGM